MLNNDTMENVRKDERGGLIVGVGAVILIVAGIPTGFIGLVSLFL